MSGIILGALGGVGNALQTIGVNAQHTMDQQDLLKTQADLGEQKAKALADYQNTLNLNNAANERTRVQGALTAAGPNAKASDILATTGDLSTANAVQSFDTKEAEIAAKGMQANAALERLVLQGRLNEAQAGKLKAELQYGSKEVGKDAFNNPILIDKATGTVTPLGTPSQNITGSTGMSGDEYLKTLSPSIAGQVKAIAEGRQPPPSGMAMRSPMGAQLMAAVSQYDPNFDGVNYGARFATRKDFTSGKSAENVTALNTAIAHLDRLSQNFDKLDNSNFRMVNGVENYLGDTFHTGDVQANLSRVGADTEAVSHELAKVFRSTGMSEGEIKAWQTKINPNLPPDSQKAVIGEAIDLMNGRLEALTDRYNKGMGTTKQPLELLTPKSQKALQRLLERSGEGHAVQGPTEDQAPAAMPTTSIPAPVAAPLTNAQGWQLHVDASGNQAYVSPDGKQVQEVP